MTCYLVLTESNIGGAEKRLARIATEILKSKMCDLKIILPESLYQKLIEQQETKDLKQFENFTIRDVVTGQGALRDVSASLKLFQERCSHRSLFHLVNLPPLFLSRSHQYLFSFTAASFNKLSLNGRLGFVASLLASQKIDLIDPTIFSYVKVLLPIKQVYMTPGTCMDFNQSDQDEALAREALVVNCGTYTKTKQVDRLLAVLPKAHEQLAVHREIKYAVVGRKADIDAEAIVAANPQFNQMNLQVGYESSPISLMSRAKVILCLNSTSNYPSRSLLEGIVCGALPVVTDVRNTEHIVPREFGEYVPKNFTAKDLSDAISRILSLSEMEYQRRSGRLVDFVKKRFSMKKSVDYYAELYNGF